jgi:chromatin remodeling complex protein RSC6
MPAAKANSKFMAPVTPNAILAEIVGAKPLPRTEIVKKIWVYIKKNKLQDTKNKRNINADEKLLKLFAGKKQVTMFDLATIISKNVTK